MAEDDDDDEMEVEEKCRCLEARNEDLQRQLDDAMSEVAVAKCVKESVVELERRKNQLESEVSTLQHLLEESHQESIATRTRHEHEVARIKAVAKQLDEENRKLKMQHQNAASFTSDDKDAALIALSDVTKSLARKVKSNFHSAMQAGGGGGGSGNVLESQQHQDDEVGGMKKAQDDAELLKSIVIPLEEQIEALKEKLRETDLLLTEAEKSQSGTVLGVEALTAWLEGASGGPETALRLLTDKEEELSPPTTTHEAAARWQMLSSIAKVRTAVLSSSLSAAKAEAAALRAKLTNGSDEAERRRDAHARNEEKLREELTKDAEFRKTVENEWNWRAEEHGAQTAELRRGVEESATLLHQLVVGFGALRDATRKELTRLTADRRRIVRELKRLQDENDHLVGRYAAVADEVQNEVIDLPENADDVHLLLLRRREELITAKLAKERLESRLRDERLAKESAEERTSREIDRLRDKISMLEEERNRADLRILEEKQKTEETALKIKTLQRDLDNSVAVQTDFVRLSQSLQVELEKIRQSEKEVRWQHEDDVNNCQGCNASFAAGRRKHHCKHCGRVFCPDCLSKSVVNGPQGRQSRVCEVCHTLLVRNSAPYFATEPPRTNR